MLRDNFSNCYFEHLPSFEIPKMRCCKMPNLFCSKTYIENPKIMFRFRSPPAQPKFVEDVKRACNLHGHTRTHKFICSHTYLHTCIHACVYIYIYTHTRTHSPNSSVASRYLCFVAFFAEEEGVGGLRDAMRSSICPLIYSRPSPQHIPIFNLTNPFIHIVWLSKFRVCCVIGV